MEAELYQANSLVSELETEVDRLRADNNTAVAAMTTEAVRLSSRPTQQQSVVSSAGMQRK